MGVRKAFGTDEDEYIRENANRLSLGQIAQILGRSRSSVQSRIKRLGIERVTYEPPRQEELPTVPGDRLRRLLALRDLMEADILGGDVPMMQRPSYFREYRALLAEIGELEGGTDAKSEGEQKNPLGEALARLADQQRRLLEQAAEP